MIAPNKHLLDILLDGGVRITILDNITINGVMGIAEQIHIGLVWDSENSAGNNCFQNCLLTCNSCPDGLWKL